jgi:hypothetical protein
MNSILGIALQLILYTLVQFFFFQGPISFELAVPKGFIVFLLFLPLGLPKPVQYLLGFGFGLVLDMLIQPFGAHALTCTLIMGVREFWLRGITSQSLGDEDEQDLDLRSQARSMTWLFSYVLPMVLLYEIVYNFISDFEVNTFVLLKVLFSGLYSFALNFAIAVLAYRKSR